MKKLLIFPIAFLFLLVPSVASATDFSTPQYEELQEYVYTTLAETSGPVSEDKREALYATLDNRTTAAHWSIELVFERAQAEINSNVRYDARELEIRAERQTVSARQKAWKWYRKNKDRPGALRAAKRRIAAATERIQSDLQKDLLLLENQADADLQTLDLEYLIQAERILSVSSDGASYIYYLPAVS